ncbi:hypothetical protein D3C86_1321050 [compost metagenome]
MDGHGGGQVFLGGGEGLLGGQAHLVLVDFLNLVDPRHVLLRDGLVLRVGHVVQRVHDRVRVELFAVVEFHALAQFEFHRLVIDLLPALGQLPPVLVGDRVVIQQRVPDVGGNDHADPHVVEVRVHAFRRLVIGHAQGVVLLAGKRRLDGQGGASQQGGGQGLERSGAAGGQRG